ncbi:MAG: hypothetical protein PW789_09635 [Edaphobacter sp.]|uniref:hypothetical protein n=1 Tax=Edaphobacter sp. TaxID=1934404 RepID=UPI00238418A5|nr:hypothetical protein [Edaphobacter sp.]MDE1176855.1 hypothetical protein [Edaphobacter sp.]
MWKGVAAGLLLLATGSVRAQIACPVMLVDGSFGKDTITVTFRDTAKVPLEQFSLTCAPSPSQHLHGSACHTETGIFYPGVPYTVAVPYPNAERMGRVTLSMREAILSSGARWGLESASKCRPLKIPTGKVRKQP